MKAICDHLLNSFDFLGEYFQVDHSRVLSLNRLAHMDKPQPKIQIGEQNVSSIKAANGVMTGTALYTMSDFLR